MISSSRILGHCRFVLMKDNALLKFFVTLLGLEGFLTEKTKESMFLIVLLLVTMAEASRQLGILCLLSFIHFIIAFPPVTTGALVHSTQSTTNPKGRP